MMRFWRDERGQDMVEYALLAAVVALTGGAVLPTLGPYFDRIFSKIVSLLSQF